MKKFPKSNGSLGGWKLDYTELRNIQDIYEKKETNDDLIYPEAIEELILILADNDYVEIAKPSPPKE